MNLFRIKCNLPSGITIYLKEINNERYIALLKYIMNNDILGFFETLEDCIIDKNINLTILDKLYIYLTLYSYSIKGTIELQSNNINTFGEHEEYSIFDILDSIEKIKAKSFNISVNTKLGNAELTLGIPSLFEILNGELSINLLSSVKKISLEDKDYILQTPDDYKTLELIFDLDDYKKIVEIVTTNYNFDIIIIKDKIILPLLSTQTYKFVIESLYYNDLDYILGTIYILLKQLGLAPSEYYKLTPADADILLLKLVKDKKEEQAASEKQNSNKDELFLENL